MRVDLFEFDLPRDRIALHPASPRESANLLVVNDDLADLQVRDLPDLVRAGDVMVFNDTRVIPARLKGRRGDARIEVTLHQQVGGGEWKAFARPAKRLKAGQQIVFDGGLTATVNAREAGEVSLTFDQRGDSFWNILDTAGQMPLPPYIGRDK
ncbi:MAG: S-adenosylmethionine:tRNA ribosyltransferase-isomerase, partial [Alphaproteobacteria bacterium]|nr:S-adenosylmethionine:tRNA ribosyltransferase-isomerase [Alphaproteobacteria bacterium]